MILSPLVTVVGKVILIDGLSAPRKIAMMKEAKHTEIQQGGGICSNTKRTRRNQKRRSSSEND